MEVKVINILLIGGNGFLGGHLVEKLVNNNELTILSRNIEFKSKYFNKYIRKIRWISGDFNNEDFIDSIDFNSFDIIIHLLSTTKPQILESRIYKDLEENVKSTIRVLEKIKNNKSIKIIYISSGGTVYGESSYILTEDASTNPKSIYGIQKLVNEKYMIYFHENYGLNISILRLSNPYGYGQINEQNHGLITQMILNINQGTKMTLISPNEITKDYIYIDDVTNAIYKSMITNSKHKVLNLSSGIGTSISSIIEVVERTLNNKLQFEITSTKSYEVSKTILSNDRIISELMWKPATGLSEGISKINNLYLLFMGGKK